MRLVVDANILVAALLKDATTREILLTENLRLFAPEGLAIEISTLLKNPKIRRRFKLRDNELADLTSVIMSHIIFFPEKGFAAFIKKSASLVTHIEDAPYIALSLALDIPLWSNDSGLKEQTLVRVITTSELIKILKI